MYFFYRLYQLIFEYASFVIRWPTPKTFKGTGALAKLGTYLPTIHQGLWLVMTDQGIVKSGLLSRLIEILDSHRIPYALYDQVLPNPTLDLIEKAALVYQTHQCQGLIAIGGGSSIDAAKGVGLRIAKPHHSFAQLRGLLKVWKRLPPLVAIPTTAGTGSEVTIAAVVSDAQTKQKYAIIDGHLIPHSAVLDPTLIVGLPPHITAMTGMDALTHAIEASLGFGPRFEKKKATLAITLIHAHLLDSFKNPSNLIHREKMLEAAYLAGQAFTRDYVGNIHAMAHALGAFYNTPHGYANAVIMPYVLRYYGTKIHSKLAKLWDLIEPRSKLSSINEKAHAFILWIEDLNHQMNLPSTIQVPRLDQIDALVEHALIEANPTYPVPVIFNKSQFKELYQKILVI